MKKNAFEKNDKKKKIKKKEEDIRKPAPRDYNVSRLVKKRQN